MGARPAAGSRVLRGDAHIHKYIFISYIYRYNIHNILAGRARNASYPRNPPPAQRPAGPAKALAGEYI